MPTKTELFLYIQAYVYLLLFWKLRRRRTVGLMKEISRFYGDCMPMRYIVYDARYLRAAAAARTLLWK